VTRFSSFAVVTVVALLAGCGEQSQSQQNDGLASATPMAPEAQSMGGEKSVTTFFVTSKGVGRGGDLGGLKGADAHCQALANAQGSGDHTWRAYLSTSASEGKPAVNARDRIGRGPWYNSIGDLVAQSVDELHGPNNRLSKDLALTEAANPVNGFGDKPNQHDILTGSRPDGMAFPPGDDLTCRNWTSSDTGKTQVGHSDRKGAGTNAQSWNSAHASAGCSQPALESTGGAGLLYCFAID